MHLPDMTRSGKTPNAPFRWRKSFLLFSIGCFGLLLLTTHLGYFDQGKGTKSNFFDEEFDTSHTPRGRIAGCSWYEQYLRLHNDNIEKLRRGDSDVKLLVYECHPSTVACGGLGDRLSGMASLFYVSVVLGRAFVVDQSMPLPLNVTLVPNSDINWDVSALILPTYSSASVKLIDKFDLTAVNKIFGADLSSKNVLRVSMNRFFTGMSLWSKLKCENRWFFGSMHRKNEACELKLNLQTPSDYFALAFDLLFKPTVEVRLRMNELSQSLLSSKTETVSKNYVGVHARLGGTVQRTTESAGWQDPERDSLSDTKQFIQCAHDRAFTLLPSTPGEPMPFFVFSDSEEFKKRISLEDSLVRYANDTYLFHIDRSRASLTTTVRGTIDATADLLLLSQARCIVASYSTFSGAASSLLRFREGKSCFFHAKSCDKGNIDFWEQTEKGFDLSECENV